MTAAGSGKAGLGVILLEEAVLDGSAFVPLGLQARRHDTLCFLCLRRREAATTEAERQAQQAREAEARSAAQRKREEAARAEATRSFSQPDDVNRNSTVASG